MEEELPRALTYYKSSTSAWRVNFNTDFTQFSLWKEIKKWQMENCQGDWSVDYWIHSTGYAGFFKEEDAMMCFLRFA